MQQCVYGTKICDIYDLQNAWCKLRLTLNRKLSRLRLNSGTTVWDHVRMLVVDTLNTCCEIVYLYYVVHQNILWNCQCNLVHLMAIMLVNIKSWICVHMHFQCFNFNKVLY